YFADQVAQDAEASGGPPLSDQDREQRAFDVFVSELRDSVTRCIDVLLEGCGTLWALLEGTAILIDADRVAPDGKIDPTARLIEHLDAGLPHGGFVHRLAVRHHLIAGGHPGEKDGAIFMVENP